jgi:hypothetical protein
MERARHYTGWAGLLAVAAELSRRGYDASITLGNTPALDLICSSPAGEPFKVQVKSASGPNWVRIQKALLEATPKIDLFLAVVLVPKDTRRPFEFYILTHSEACDLYGKQRRTRLDGRPYKPGFEGLSWGDVRPYVSRWDKLPK